MTVYRVGQIWELDGKRREIVAIRTGIDGRYHRSTEGLTRYSILWQRDMFGTGGCCWNTGWQRWAKGAKLVGDRQ